MRKQTLACLAWREANQEAIIEQQEAEHENQIVEKRIVRRGNHADLPGRHNAETHDSPGPWQEPDPHDYQLQGERGKCGGSMKPMRKVLHIPADPRGKRSVLVILVYRREMPPFRVAAATLSH